MQRSSRVVFIEALCGGVRAVTVEQARAKMNAGIEMQSKDIAKKWDRVMGAMETHFAVEVRCSNMNSGRQSLSASIHVRRFKRSPKFATCCWSIRLPCARRTDYL